MAAASRGVTHMNHHLHDEGALGKVLVAQFPEKTAARQSSGRLANISSSTASRAGRQVGDQKEGGWRRRQQVPVLRAHPHLHPTQHLLQTADGCRTLGFICEKGETAASPTSPEEFGSTVVIVLVLRGPRHAQAPHGCSCFPRHPLCHVTSCRTCSLSAIRRSANRGMAANCLGTVDLSKLGRRFGRRAMARLPRTRLLDVPRESCVRGLSSEMLLDDVSLRREVS